MKRLLTAVLLIISAAGFSAAQETLPKDSVITLERTPCFGMCDSYKLTISANGDVEFVPKRHGADHKPGTGTRFKDRISLDMVKQLVAEFEKINHFSLCDRYDISSDKLCPRASTDHPSAITSITIDGKSKEVHHYHGCEGNPILDKLTALEDKNDQIAVRPEWILELRKQ